MSRTLAAIGSISGLIKQLSDNAEYLEELFEQREMYLEPGDTDLRPRIERLRRERVVRIEPDNHGGGLVRLSSHVRQLFIQSTRRDRVQGLDINVKDTFDRVDMRLEGWRHAQKAHALDESEVYEGMIRDDLELIEHRYTERLEQIQDRISVSYGFDIQDESRSREFRYYLDSIEEMRVAGREFCRILSDEAYDDVPFINLLAARMDVRFRRHGETIADIRRSLDQYLARVRDRQVVTRRNMRFLQWMRSRPGRLDLGAGLANADRLALVHRPEGLSLSATPDTGNPIYRSAFEDIAGQIKRRYKARMSARDSRVPEPAAERTDSTERARRAVDAHEDEVRQQWDPAPWLDDFLLQSIRIRLGQPGPDGLESSDSQGLSAMAYWHYRDTVRSDHRPRPTKRAWLSELLQMALTNRPIGRRPFFDRFQIEFYSDSSVCRPHSQRKVADVVIAPRDDSIAQIRQSG